MFVFPMVFVWGKKKGNVSLFSSSTTLNYNKLKLKCVCMLQQDNNPKQEKINSLEKTFAMRSQFDF